MTDPARKYHQAAISYFIYGVIYLGGAVYLSVTGEVPRARLSGGVIWFLMGALFVFGLPPLIWMGFKWVTRILAVLVAIRLIGLVRVIAGYSGQTVPFSGGLEIPVIWGAVAFFIVAAVTCFMLIRAGWNVNLSFIARRKPASGDERNQ